MDHGSEARPTSMVLCSRAIRTSGKTPIIPETQSVRVRAQRWNEFIQSKHSTSIPLKVKGSVSPYLAILKRACLAPQPGG